MMAAAESRRSRDCLILLCHQFIVYCCHHMSLRLRLGNRTLSHTAFVVFVPLWAVALLAAFLFHQTLNRMHCCHRLTRPLLCL
jgi:hypothetical protein